MASKQADDVMTIDELAAYLKLSKSSLYHFARAGKVPGWRNWRSRPTASAGGTGITWWTWLARSPQIMRMKAERRGHAGALLTVMSRSRPKHAGLLLHQGLDLRAQFLDHKIERR